MKTNDFVFADLSTYGMDIAQDFYSKVFGWHYGKGIGDYLIAKHNALEIAGLYETPQRFKDINMPSFWMSYIQVNDIEKTVKLAKERDGIIELVEDNKPMGKIALIRDPLGAGFTIYEGDFLNSRFENEKNALVWNELFISDFSKVKPFYESIFKWEITSAKNDRYFISNAKGEKIGAIQEVDSQIKGKYEYWGVFFAVENVSQIKKAVLNNGGTLVYEDENFTCLADPFGAFFHVVPLQKNSKSKTKIDTKRPFKWKAIIGLLLIALNLMTGWYWIWTVFFLFWIVLDIQSGYTHLFEPVYKKQNPVLYWIIIGIWASLGVYSTLYYTQMGWS